MISTLSLTTSSGCPGVLPGLTTADVALCRRGLGLVMLGRGLARVVLPDRRRASVAESADGSSGMKPPDMSSSAGMSGLPTDR